MIKNDNEVRSFRFPLFFFSSEKKNSKFEGRHEGRVSREDLIARGKGRGARVTGTPGIRVIVRKVKRR